MSDGIAGPSASAQSLHGIGDGHGPLPDIALPTLDLDEVSSQHTWPTPFQDMEHYFPVDDYEVSYAPAPRPYIARLNEAIFQVATWRNDWLDFGSPYICQFIGCFQRADNAEDIESHFEHTHYPYIRLYPPERYICGNNACMVTNMVHQSPCLSCSTTLPPKLWICGEVLHAHSAGGSAPDYQANGLMMDRQSTLSSLGHGVGELTLGNDPGNDPVNATLGVAPYEQFDNSFYGMDGTNAHQDQLPPHLGGLPDVGWDTGTYHGLRARAVVSSATRSLCTVAQSARMRTTMRCLRIFAMTSSALAFIFGLLQASRAIHTHLSDLSIPLHALISTSSFVDTAIGVLLCAIILGGICRFALHVQRPWPGRRRQVSGHHFRTPQNTREAHADVHQAPRSKSRCLVHLLKWPRRRARDPTQRYPLGNPPS